MNKRSSMHVKEKPLVTICILNYNGLMLGHLEIVLESVIKTNYPNFEVLVVDNGSTDDSVKFIKQNYPGIKVVKLKKNYGPAIGYNICAIKAKGELVAILNNDIEVKPNWLQPLVKYIQLAPWIVACDPKFMSYYDRKRFDDTAAAGRFIDYFGNNYTRGVNETDYGQYDKPVYILGTLTLFKRDIFLKSGGFDSKYFYGYEDMDLTWRLYLLGYRSLYVPESIIYHKSGGTARKAKRFRPLFYYRMKKNRLITLTKNYSIKNMLVSLYVTLFEYLLTMIYYSLKRDPEYSKCILKAIIDYLKELKSIMIKRNYIQSIRKVSDSVVRRFMVPYSGIFWELIKKKT